MTIRYIPQVFSAALVLAAAPCASAATLFFDFGAGGTAATFPTNSVAEAQVEIASATDITGSATGIRVNTSGFNASNTAGTQSASGAAAIFDIASTRDSLFGNALADFNGVRRAVATLTFSGLDGTGATGYSFDFFASRNGGTQNRETQYAVAGLGSSTVFLDAANNATNLATVNGMIPTAGGNITVTMTLGPNNNTTEGFYYLGALRLTTAPVPEPTVTLLAALGAAMAFRRRRA